MNYDISKIKVKQLFEWNKLYNDRISKYNYYISTRFGQVRLTRLDKEVE